MRNLYARITLTYFSTYNYTYDKVMDQINIYNIGNLPLLV